MTSSIFPKKVYHFEHYDKTPADIKPFVGNYDKRLFKDHYHKIPIKLNIPDNVSDIIYGKSK